LYSATFRSSIAPLAATSIEKLTGPVPAVNANESTSVIFSMMPLAVSVLPSRAIALADARVLP
jgi:hypothetical protein